MRATDARVASLIIGRPPSARDTVLCEIPSASVMSRMVGAAGAAAAPARRPWAVALIAAAARARPRSTRPRAVDRLGRRTRRDGRRAAARAARHPQRGVDPMARV